MASDTDTADAQRQNNRRDKLLQAAAHLFASQGYEATSMRDIASAVGMLPGSVYYHFPSKEDLFVAVHDEGMRQITDAVEAAIAGIDDPWDRLEAAAAGHMEALLADSGFASVVTPEYSTKLAQASASLIAQRDAYERKFAGLVDALPLAPDVDRRMLRLGLLGMLNWARTWYRPGPGHKTPARIGREMVALLRGRAHQ
ncbi:TetR/AcrR family transcriptional regulator [Tistrella bauzanensis]|uniref:TetR/AcrR family transcriptional regulator n=1 Tax=Tistrella TaxID=171436 RepID=UPI0031F6DC60